MSATVQSAVYKMGLDSGSYEQAAARVDQANRKMMASTEGVAVAEEKVNQATRTTADGFAKLEAKLDPLTRIELRRNQELQRATRYLEEGRVAQDRYAAYVDRLTRHYDTQAAALRRLGSANDNVRAGMGRFGGTLQQVGYQVGDFAVQVASGQGVLRPLIQQGTQVISAFGPWGAVLGAAGAVVGALATSLFDLGDGLTTAQRAVTAFNEAMEKSNELLLTSDELAQERQRSAVNEAKEKIQSALALETENVALAQNILLQQKRQAELSKEAATGARGGRPAVGAAGISFEAATRTAADLEKQISEATLRIGNLLEQYRKLDDPSQLGRAREDKIKAENEALEEQERRLAAIRKNDNELAAQQDKDRLAAMERGKRIIEADAQERLRIEKNLEKERIRAEEKVARERERELERYERQLQRTVEHTTDRLVDFAGDSIFRALTGQAMSFWDSFKDYGLRMMSQLAAELAIRPLATALTPDIAGDEPIQGMLRA